MTCKHSTRKNGGKYRNENFEPSNPSDINTLALPLLIFPALHLVIDEDVKRRNCCERSEDTPEDNQEIAHNYLPSLVSVAGTVVVSVPALAESFISLL